MSIKKSIEQVIEVAKTDLLKKNIELTMSFSDDIPANAKGDSFKFK